MNNQLITNYYITHRDELLAYVSSRLHSSSPLGSRGGGEEAEDLVQNVFLRLLTSQKMITEVTLPALVYTITRNLITDYHRHRTVFDTYEHYLKKNNETDDSVESVLSIREITEQLERGLARLPENCREVYRLHIYGDMKVSEISKVLGEGYKSVEHRLGTARQNMRRYMRLYA